MSEWQCPRHERSYHPDTAGPVELCGTQDKWWVESCSRQLQRCKKRVIKSVHMLLHLLKENHSFLVHMET